MRRDEDRRTPFDVAEKNVPHDPRNNRIHALEGFVEEQQIRIGQHCSGQRELLAHPVRIFQHELLVLCADFENRKEFLDSLRDRVLAQKVHPPNERKVLTTGEQVEQRQVLRYHSDAASDGHGCRDVRYARPQQENLPRGGRKDAREHLDGGGLACAVAAQKTVHRTGLHPEVQRIDRAQATKVACQSPSFNSEVRWRHPPLPSCLSVREYSQAPWSPRLSAPVASLAPVSRCRRSRRLPPARGECPGLSGSTPPPRPHCRFSAGSPGRASAVHSGAMPSRPPGRPTRRTGPGQ